MPQDPLTAKRLILDLLSTVERGSVEVARLVTAAEVLGIPANRLRVALARLVRAGLVESERRGRYRLGAAADAVNAQVTGWRRSGAECVRWRGGWIGVLCTEGPRAQRPRQERDERALRFAGLRPLEPALWVRPDNLRGGVGSIRARLRALGLDEARPVFELAGLEPRLESRARGLWDARTIRRECRRLVERLEASARSLPGMERRAAMRESFLLGGEAIRVLALDPRLPEELVPASDRHALMRAMDRYDRLGRDCWRGVLVASGRRPAHGPARNGSVDLREAASVA